MRIDIDEEDVLGFINLIADKVAERVHDYSKKLQFLRDKETVLDERIRDINRNPNILITTEHWFTTAGGEIFELLISNGIPTLLKTMKSGALESMKQISPEDAFRIRNRLE